MRRDAHIDGLRGLAMSLVFLVHFGGASARCFEQDSAAGSLLASLSTGQFGSTIFLLIVGYSLYARAREQQEFKWGPFLRSRARRIIPLYWFTLAVDVICSACLNQHDKLPADGWSAVVYIAQNALLVAPFLGTPTMVAVAWTLSYLLLGYLMVPAMGRALNHYSFGRGSRIGLIVGVAAAWVIAPRIWSGLATNGIGLAYGMLLYEANDAWSFRRLPGRLVDAAAFVALIAGFLFFAATSSGVVALPESSGHLVRVLATALPVCLLFAGRLTRSGRLNQFLAGRFGGWLGEISYSYYLFHGLVVIAARSVFSSPEFRELVPAPLVLIVGLPLCYAASLAVAAVVHYRIEIPLERVLRSKPEWRARQVVAVTQPLARAAAAGSR